MSSKEPLSHPGDYIKTTVLPVNMTVTAAAHTLGVSRAALSRLLNGNSSLSAVMASRLEKSFDASAEQLLELQADFDQQQMSKQNVELAVRTYSPSLHEIRALSIDQWFRGSLDGRAVLPALLRRLVHASNVSLNSVDFPAYDNSQRHGWDGTVSSNETTPWIPLGESRWEFGCSQNPADKATRDYLNRIESVQLASDRQEITFVFVTPLHWPGKHEWVTAYRKQGDWKQVLAFDADDLEQWIEQSPPCQVWLAERMGLPTEHTRSLENCWATWAAASDPQMTPELFAPAPEAHVEMLRKWLNADPERPLVISADSRQEALAYIWCLCASEAVAQKGLRETAIVFDSAIPLRRIADTAAPFTAIVVDRDTQLELPTVVRRRHCIVFRPRYGSADPADIEVGPISHDAFISGVQHMGFDRDQATDFARKSCLSPTILRRQLSIVDAIRTPSWATDENLGRSLIPYAFIRAWDTDSRCDREIVEAISDQGYHELESNFNALLRVDDSPVWTAGKYCGTVSQIDSLYAVHGLVTTKSLENLLVAAEYVLSERDPALDLPEDQQWAAAIHGKTLDHSSALRDGLCDCLALLAVHGNDLFRRRLGIDIRLKTESVVHRLLDGFSEQSIRSLDRFLPKLAEAAPEVFLEAIENDLTKDESVVESLMGPATSSTFGAMPSRTGILWSLEALAWNPRNLSRVCAILARLSRIEIDDNWANKPQASLNAIFRAWLPQTGASVAGRIVELDSLVEKFPDIGWKICVNQFVRGSQFGHHSNRPRWRADANGFGNAASSVDRRRFVGHCIDVCLGWTTHSANTLGDLIDRVDLLTSDQVDVFISSANDWKSNTTSELEQAEVFKKLQRMGAIQRAAANHGSTMKEKLSALENTFAPDDPVIRNLWMFETEWSSTLFDSPSAEELPFNQREIRAREIRIDALTQIWDQSGKDGTFKLIRIGGLPHLVGDCLRDIVPTGVAQVEFVKELATNSDTLPEDLRAGCLRGFLSRENSVNLYHSVRPDLNDDAELLVLLSMQPNAETWELLDQPNGELYSQYWKSIRTYGYYENPETTQYVVDRFLEFDRGVSAFSLASIAWETIETSRLLTCLRALPTSNQESFENISNLGYAVSSGLTELSRRPGVSQQDLTQLEFFYIDLLEHSKHGIPNLERSVCDSPDLFVEFVCHAFNRRNGTIDPKYASMDELARQNLARSSFNVLEQLKTLPGTSADGTVDQGRLNLWLSETINGCNQNGRGVVGAQMIGRLLANAAGDFHNAWPGNAVCTSLERLASPDVGLGFQVGVANLRGVYSPDGGKEETALAEMYRDRAERLQPKFLFASKVLFDIANSYGQDADRELDRSTADRYLNN